MTRESYIKIVIFNAEKYKCLSQQLMIERIEEEFPEPTDENIRQIVTRWEDEKERGRAQSDDTQLLHTKIKQYIERNYLEYCTQTMVNLGSKYYLRWCKETKRIGK